MTVKFTNPTEKHVYFLLGNEKGTLDMFSVFIQPNRYSIYEMRDDVWDRFLKGFEVGMKELEIQYDRL